MWSATTPRDLRWMGDAFLLFSGGGFLVAIYWVVMYNNGMVMLIFLGLLMLLGFGIGAYRLHKYGFLNTWTDDEAELFQNGICYAEGRGVPVDPNKALACFQSSSDKGYVLATAKLVSEFNQGAYADSEKAQEYMKQLKRQYQEKTGRKGSSQELDRLIQATQNMSLVLELLVFPEDVLLKQYTSAVSV